MSKEYRPQLQISGNDPLCAATNLGDCVIGVLFDKKGSEIKGALKARMGLVTDKVASYEAVSGKIDEFIVSKRKILKELDDYYQSRCDDKESLIKPYQRQIDEIVKRCQDTTFDFDKATYKGLGDKAVRFEDGFEGFQPSFSELDEFLRKEEEVISEPLRGAGYGDRVTDIQGPTGMQGATGMQGIPGLKGSTGVSGRTGADEDLDRKYSPIEESLDSTEEDRALAKMRTLRSLLQKYVSKVERLKEAIKRLRYEYRRLKLIHDNISDDRVYKLDLNKLSAFGFEDLEIVS